MSSTSSKQPVKKRRIDDIQNDPSLPGPSREVLPLVAPQLVKKTSKDVNRGMYPYSKGKYNKLNHNSSVSSPDFVKASQLRRIKKEKESEASQAHRILPLIKVEEDSEVYKPHRIVVPIEEEEDSEVYKTNGIVVPVKEEKDSEVSKPHRIVVPIMKEAAEAPQAYRIVPPIKEEEDTDDAPNSDYDDETLKVRAKSNQSKDGKHLASARIRFSHRLKRMRQRAKPLNNGKITNYFKSSPVKAENKTKLVKAENERKPSVATKSSGPSGWEWKAEQISETLASSNESFFKHYRDCFGLVENPVEEMAEDYFNTLPTQIIETILSQIPMLDFMNCRLVCSRWRQIIDNEKFMEWKKLYYRYKKNITKSLSPHKKKLSNLIITTLKYNSLEDCIPTLFRFLATKFSRLPSIDMHDLLMTNSKGELADQVLKERFPEYTGKEQRVWCQFALAILLCETVWEIFHVYQSLFTSKMCASRTDVTDVMYCLATFLLHFRSCDGINSGLHYRLYYCLYLIENNVPEFQKEKLKVVSGLRGQQSLHNYCKPPDASNLTYEQIRILNHQFDMNQKIRIIALAGTGKTTTLLYLAKLYPQIKFLNLVFNRSVNEESKKKFPQNVTCKTAHSLAYAAVGKFMRHKLTTTLRPYDLIGHLSHNEEHIQIYAYANLVLTTITNFIVSSSSEMGLIHVPTQDFNHKTLTHLNRDHILMDAYKIWQKMINKDDPFKITHDVYLKLYHLGKPNLDKFQCIMVDEAQDCNPVILDIVLKQTMPVIFVGDPNQQIYGFRGAQNALQCITATHTYHLTKSFRFGPEIAYLASCVLELLLNSKTATIVGNTSNSYINGKARGQYAVISRTNIMLFNEALRMIVFKQLKSSEPSVINATFAGGFNSYGFDQISDIYNLKALSKGTREMNDKFISRFKTYADLVNYARYSDDTDLLSKIEIVNQHGHDISRFISILKEKCNHPMEAANVVFSTAHKAKGLEFDTVCLTDDYPISTPYLDFDLVNDEANILYVAITRAKRCLLLPEKMTKLLHLAFEKFEYPVSSKSVLQDKVCLNCIQCDERFVPHTVLMLHRRQLILASERKIEEGPLCMKCSSDPHMRPDVHMNGLVMYLDPTSDNSHRFMSSIAGPLPNDPPIVHDRFAEYHNADRVLVINLNML